MKIIDRVNKKLNQNQTFRYNNRLPTQVDPSTLSEQQIFRLTESKTFCILPWIHVHGFPDGRAYPCCASNMWHPLGDLKKSTIEEVWNSQEFKTMRRNMLDDKPCKECNKCYELEENGFFSMRNSFSRDFGHYINLVDKTQEDGAYNDCKIRYFDIRFSNLCNFRCRTCGPLFSSNWYNDHIKLYNRKPDLLGKDLERVEYAGKHKYDIWEQMQQHIPYLDQIYFAGGEPLIMEEHYLLIKELVKRKMFHVRLVYNTNFSEIIYKDQDVMELWKLFDSVSVGASLDAAHDRGEYMRKGQNWKQTIKNRERMQKICPRVDFYVSSTVSIYNVDHVTDFHREWADLGLIRPMDWNINLCQSPSYTRANILPKIFKEKIIDKINKHINWLEPLDQLTRATHGYRGIINFLQQDTDISELNDFFKINDAVDSIRQEKFEIIFPEYQNLRNYINGIA